MSINIFLPQLSYATLIRPLCTIFPLISSPFLVLDNNPNISCGPVEESHDVVCLKLSLQRRGVVLCFFYKLHFSNSHSVIWFCYSHLPCEPDPPRTMSQKPLGFTTRSCRGTPH